jgi:hypothetical protein
MTKTIVQTPDAPGGLGARWFTTAPPARHGALLPLPARLSAVLISIGAIATLD